jgi:hypothetical protein
MIHNNLAEGEVKRNIFAQLVYLSQFRTDRNTSFDAAVRTIVKLYRPSLIHNLISMNLLFLKFYLLFSLGRESAMINKSG